jgi:hypothetical protein
MTMNQEQEFLDVLYRFLCSVWPVTTPEDVVTKRPVSGDVNTLSKKVETSTFQFFLLKCFKSRSCRSIQKTPLPITIKLLSDKVQVECCITFCSRT